MIMLPLLTIVGGALLHSPSPSDRPPEPRTGIVAIELSMFDQEGGEYSVLMSYGHWLFMEELAGGRVPGGVMDVVLMPGCGDHTAPQRVTLKANFSEEICVGFDEPLTSWECFVVVGWIE